MAWYIKILHNVQYIIASIYRYTCVNVYIYNMLILTVLLHARPRPDSWSTYPERSVVSPPHRASVCAAPAAVDLGTVPATDRPPTATTSAPRESPMNPAIPRPLRWSTKLNALIGDGEPHFFIISVASRLLHLLRFDQIYRKGICGWLHGYLEENHRTPSCDIVKTHVDVGTLAIRLWQKFKSHHSLMQRWADHAPFLTIRSHSDSGYPETNDFPI